MEINKPKEMIDWAQVRMPEIIIECDDVIITKCEDETFDHSLRNLKSNEYNLLPGKLNLEDTDSGIHESNYILVTGLHTSIHSNRRSLREMKKKPKLSEKRSYSTNNLTETFSRYHDDFDIMNQNLCRNCSMKTQPRKERDKIINVDKIKTVEKKAELPKIIPENNSFQQRVCRISILLVCMKILLGSTMTALGLYLRIISISIAIKDCAFWASAPLFLSGILDIYFCTSRETSKNRRKPNYAIIVICGIISLICSVICLLSSIFSGIHGNWISGHSDNCYSDDIESKGGILSACCYTNSTIPNICICREAVKSVDLTAVISRTYENLTCRYVFSAIKDYLILQCALMAVGSGVSLWWLQIMIQRIVNDLSSISRLAYVDDEDQNSVRQSPVVPLKLRCTIPSETFLIIKDVQKDKKMDYSISTNNNKYS